MLGLVGPHLRSAAVVLISLLVGAHCDPRPAPQAVGVIPIADASNLTGTVYDPTQRVYWLADANLAGDPSMRAMLGVAGVNDNGTMNYATAVRWVAALNAFNGGAGYLGHHNWQLPVTPESDTTCAIEKGNAGNSFGPGCIGSALGRLFATTLRGTFPEGFGAQVHNRIGPLHDLKQGLYWTSGTLVADPTPWDSASAFTFTFTSGVRGRNTTRANFFYVLPVVRGAIGTAPTGTGLVPYTSGPAAGLAVYDTVRERSWPISTALAASNHYGVDGTVTLQFRMSSDITTPRITTGGAMQFETIPQWLRGMNAESYAGSTRWTLPTVDELRDLHERLGLAASPGALLTTDEHAGFRRMQHFFYWACQRDQSGDSRSPCNGASPGPAPNGVDRMRWAVNFQSGFQGTDEEGKEFFVVPYFPAP